MDESNTQNYVSALREFVTISSPSGNEAPAVEYLVKIMKEFGLNAYVDETGNAVGTNDGKGKHILMVGHIDTVTGIIPVEESKGTLYGRGTVDAKGPLMSMVFAAAKFVKNDDIKVTVVGAVEEETTSRGARALNNQLQPDYIIIGEPSGWDSICIGYKGHIRATYRVQCPHVHRAHPRANAIEVALQYYAEVQTLCGPKDYFNQKPLFDSLTVAPMDIIINRDEQNTTVELVLDIRVPYNMSLLELEDNLKSISNDGELQIFSRDPPVLVGKNNKLVRSFLSAIRKNNGEPRFKKKTGTSDMNILAQYWSVPILSYGPGDSSLDHTAGERIQLDDYTKAIQIISEAIDLLR
jgi:LysW-gamma-L-lysine carboxypeptidase